MVVGCLALNASFEPLTMVPMRRALRLVLDGKADIITGAAGGAGGPHVKVFDGLTGDVKRSFLAYDAGFTGGVNVGAADVNGDGKADVITGTGGGAAGGHVKVFNGVSGAEIRSFLAYDAGFTGGVSVAAWK